MQTQNPKPSPAAQQVLSGVIRRDGIEDMSGAVRNFFDLEAVQLEPGVCRCQIDFVAAGRVFFYREHYPLRTQLVGELLHHRFGFAIPEEGPGIKFDGEQMDGCRLASAMTGEQMDVFAPGGLKQFVVLIDHAHLLRLAEETNLPWAVQQALRPGRSTMPLVSKPSAVSALSRRLRQVLRQAAAGRLQMEPAALEDWIYAEALSILDITGHPCGRPPAAVVVRRATEIADAQPGPWRIASLCSQLHVSPSTLQYAFKTITGLSPHAFFLHRKLNRARVALLRAHPGESKVTDIAVDLGFSELGRFSVRYRRLFGESPSETLRRSPRISTFGGF
jgi:AraC family ethanolamine operon transcriptional activator